MLCCDVEWILCVFTEAKATGVALYKHCILYTHMKGRMFLFIRVPYEVKHTHHPGFSSDSLLLS